MIEPVLKNIYKTYNLKLDFVEKVAQGFLSDNYVLSDGGVKYFLKKYRFTNIQRIKEVHSVKQYFNDDGVPVIMPIINKEGETFFESDGNFYTLFSFVEDCQLHGNQVTQRAIVSLAKMLGQIHLLGKKSKLPVNVFFKPWSKENSLKQAELILKKIDSIKDKSVFDLRAEKNVLLKKKLIEGAPRDYDSFNFSNDHLIHGDYMIWNVFFAKNDEVSWVFDFEKTKYSPRYFELFRSMIYSAFLGDAIDQKAIDDSKVYLESYREVYPISKEEIVEGFLAYYIRSIHSLWLEAEHYLKNSTRADELLKSDILRTKYLSEHFKEFRRYLIND